MAKSEGAREKKIARHQSILPENFIRHHQRRRLLLGDRRRKTSILLLSRQVSIVALEQKKIYQETHSFLLSLLHIGRDLVG